MGHAGRLVLPPATPPGYGWTNRKGNPLISLMKTARKVRIAVVAGATVGMLATGAGISLASSASPSRPAAPAAPAAPHVNKVCDQYGVNVMHNDYNGAACPSGWYQTSWSDTNGSLDTTWTLPALTPLAHIGGPIQANGTTLGTITLATAGTYLVDANAMFNRGAAAATADPDTYPVITVWQGTAWSPDFSNTVGTWSGGRMSRDVHIDTTASGSAVVKVPAGGTTLHVVGFAYNEDRSSTGSVNAENASVSVVRVG